jgi:acetyl/propionyl-CoA carboxylase alpha subunit
MLGKISVHAADRQAALTALVGALDANRRLRGGDQRGIPASLVAGDEFAAAAIDTQWLDSSPAAQGYLQRPEPTEGVWAQAARVVVAATGGRPGLAPLRRRRRLAAGGRPRAGTRPAAPWRVGARGHRRTGG